MEDERRDVEAAQAVPNPAPPVEPEAPVDQNADSKECEPSKEREAERESEMSAIREFVDLIGRAAVWALILYLFVFQVSVVEGPSMQPNFRTGDRLMIDKVTYRLSPVKRLDVIVFQMVEYSWNRADRESKDYIKRVIGLPGEHVSLKGNKVFINGKELVEPFQFDRQICYYGVPDEFVVPPKHYFVLGDNRGDSKDSRSPMLGFVPESQIRGIARLRFLPLSRWQWFDRY